MTGPEAYIMFQIWVNKLCEQTYVNRDIGDHDKLQDLWELRAKNQSFDMMWMGMVTYKYFRRVVGEEGSPGTKDVVAVHTERIGEGDSSDREAVPLR